MQLAVIRRFPPRATTPTSGRGLGYKKTDFGVFPDARDVPADPPWGGLRSVLSFGSVDVAVAMCDALCDVWSCCSDYCCSELLGHLLPVLCGGVRRG